MHYKDIIILDTKENLNNGKLYHMFNYFIENKYEFDYIMKTDDDSFIHKINLLKVRITPLSENQFFRSIPQLLDKIQC
jgi:hypothetical protein